MRRKTVKGRFYYYLEESIRLEKPKVYSISLGVKIPPKKELEKKEQELTDKIYSDLLHDAQTLYLSKERLIGIERKRRQYEMRLRRLTKGAREEKAEVDIVNFVYTTLSTEGVPITREDADLAYRFAQKGVRDIRDENLRVSLDMIKGLRQVRESKRGLGQEFILDLHATIIDGFADKNPGKLRTKPAYIYLKSYDKVQEIGFRPPAPDKIKTQLDGLVSWYNSKLGKLNAIELAALVHLKFYSIHPFEDGNKRMSRLLLNKAFQDSKYPILNVSKQTAQYFDALVKSVEKQDERPFVEFVAREFEKMCSKKGN